MQSRKKKAFILAILIQILITALTSCKTLRSEEKKTIQIEAQFPSPYDENGNQIVILEDDVVKMPLWYWLKITEFAVDVETNLKLQELKE